MPDAASYSLPESTRSLPFFWNPAQTTPVRPKVPPRLITSSAGSMFRRDPRSSFFGSMTSKIWERRRSACSTSSAMVAERRRSGFIRDIKHGDGDFFCLAPDHAEVVLRGCGDRDEQTDEN